MAIKDEFQPDQHTTPEGKNTALSDLLRLGGAWHRYDTKSFKRFELQGARGWQVTYDDGVAEPTASPSSAPIPAPQPTPDA